MHKGSWAKHLRFNLKFKKILCQIDKSGFSEPQIIKSESGVGLILARFGRSATLVHRFVIFFTFSDLEFLRFPFCGISRFRVFVFSGTGCKSEGEFQF